MLQEPDLSQHLPLFQQYQDHPNYFRAGPNNLPVVSSYWGYWQMNDWATFEGDSDLYLMLDLDDTYAGQGDTSPYYADPSGQLSEFNNIVDGYFSWDSAWPALTNGPVNVTAGGDTNVITFAHGAQKDYMMGISPLQYKDLNGETWYRVGEANLPERMEQILAIKPDFTEFITWNDAGESHYIGNVWEEGYDPAIITYANNDQWPHHAWQPLPPSDAPIGVMWYRGMLSSCAGNQPQNADAALDAVNYAIVLPASSAGLMVQVTSGGNILTTIDLQPGLNYAAVTGMGVGTQRVEILNGDGAVVMGATGSVEVTDSSTCNFNYYVVGLQ
ncbi:glycosyl hydrolase family 71-domain-containing protein [Aspergillus germanicus]